MIKFLLGYEPKRTVAEIATTPSKQVTASKQTTAQSSGTQETTVTKQTNNKTNVVLPFTKNEGYKNINTNTMLDVVFDVFE